MNMTWPRLVKASYLLLLMVILPVMGCAVNAQSDRVLGASQIPPAFADVYQEVSSATSIPVLVPTAFPREALREPDADVPLYTSIDLAERNQYEINFDAIDGCFGAGYCTFGAMGAQRITRDTPSVDEQYAYFLDPNYQPVRRSEEPIANVRLTGDIEGIFIPWVCGANCSAAKVYWEQEGIRYFVGIRMADMDTVVALANSMIENAPSPNELNETSVGEEE
ncbi:MAG: hypothetical protein F6K00_33620 [Leptolyngbya sp. SIOISBB]|nr:hypothetical protein [Leptolyngbya sp. SIOISBB]